MTKWAIALVTTLCLNAATAAATGVGVARISAPTSLSVSRTLHPFLFRMCEIKSCGRFFRGRWAPSIDAEEICGKSTNVEAPKMEVVQQFRGSQASLGIGPSQEIARDPQTWGRIWARAAGARIPRPEAPAIDFDRHMAIAIFMGKRRTGGYNVNIESVREFDELIEVRYSSTSPTPGDMVPMALTSPYHIVVVRRVEEKDVTFINEQEGFPQRGKIPRPRPPGGPWPRETR